MSRKFTCVWLYSSVILMSGISVLRKVSNSVSSSSSSCQLLYYVKVTQPLTDLFISIIVCAVVELIMSHFQTYMHDLDRDNFMYNRKQI